MSAGDLNIIDALINAEMRIEVLEEIIKRMLDEKNNSIRWDWTANEIKAIRTTKLEKLQKKYPDAGIKQIP